MFFDRPAPGSKAMLVFIRNKTSDLATHEEVEELARSAGMAVVGLIESARRDPHPKTMVGSGKVDEIKVAAEAAGANLVLFSEDLSSTQERNLEGALDLRVLGRTGLILEIFAQRARTHEGKLQVELAQLEHSASRLVRGWTHLDRQRGGAGAGLGGAGETQLEADQRLLAARNKKIKERLERVQRQRHQSRRARARSETATVALAGYTNAGKSTLFNRLTQSAVHAADQLFATLDPTLRQISLPLTGKAVISDTVGFIRALPHGLVESFKATLEEVTEATLILHVVDASAGEKQERMDAVNGVLSEIGAREVPQLLVLNKSDIQGVTGPLVRRDAAGKPYSVQVSSLTGVGLPELLSCIDELISDDVVTTVLTLKPEQGMIRAKCFELASVIEEVMDENGTIAMHLRIEKKNLARLNAALTAMKAG
ncbi:MAG: GTPase HflX [Gammaproteobacteria bacterium]|jgi:GTP-binding protein HflX|nr:GTPase HflX [Gammaproteobacteria bacterium]MBT7389380.1 GTPase HflX [Gammaproteobacteria bacterium]MCH9820350.1 GTPase HflX [Gammaproteobacteria bacterium]MDB2706733.1 GTPase HflX [Pseudomonadales bacterium]MDC1366435.1 GTPase HflX [Pseudomonadales bacterium]